MNKKIARALADAGVVRFGSFTYVSGKRGPVYVDVRVLPSTVASMDAVTDAMAEQVRALEPDVLAGAETAGIPLAAVLSIKTRTPMVYVRKKPKEHGTRSQIEGRLDEGKRVLLVDDMVTDGGSKLRFIEGIRAAGCTVEDVLIVLDREQGATEVLGKEGVRLHALITLRELLGYMADEDLVEKELYGEVLGYLDDPDRWERTHPQ